MLNQYPKFIWRLPFKFSPPPYVAYKKMMSASEEIRTLKIKVISNSTPIIGLSIIGKLHLLNDLFEEVYIPETVYQEVVNSDSPRQYGRKRIEKIG